MSRLAPTNIQPIGNELAIAWNDGTESYVPLEFLRRACPCAACGGEPDVMGHVVRPEVVYTPDSFVLKGFAVVGSYAVQPAWADGHGTGLYSFPYLQRLAAESAAGKDAMTRAAKLCLLGFLFAVCGAAALFQSVLDRRWQSTPPPNCNVVSTELTAFRADDYSTAYRQVSMSFQEKFNLEAFADLARTDYPALLRAAHVEFGQVRFQGRRAFLPAYFILPDGDIIPCVYTLVREEDAWKIDNARVMPRWPTNRRLGGLRT